MPLWPTSPNHSCYLARLDAAPTDNAFSFLRETPPSTLDNLPDNAPSSINSLSGRELAFFGSQTLPACAQKSS